MHISKTKNDVQADFFIAVLCIYISEALMILCLFFEFSINKLCTFILAKFYFKMSTFLI